ncbi:UAA transporter [Tulasnella sp. 424]|nr:UAA transporter [Tulasnella sp. 424]
MPRSRSPSPIPCIIEPSTPPPTPPLSADPDSDPFSAPISYPNISVSPSKDGREAESRDAPAIPVLDVPEDEPTTENDELRTPSKRKQQANSFLSPSESTTLHESHLSPYGGSTYSASLAGSPYVSPTAVHIVARSPGKPRNDGMYSSPTSSPTKTKQKAPTSPIKSPEKAQTSPKKKAASQLGAPPPYSRYNTYTYSVKYQGQKLLGLGGPPFPSLFHNISTAPLSSSSPGPNSLPTPLPTPTNDSFGGDEESDAFDSRPLSLSPYPSNTSTPKPFGVSHACYDPSPSRSSFGGSPFYFEPKPKKPQPRPRITSAPDTQANAHAGRSQLREAYEIEACLSHTAEWRPTSRWSAMLPSLRVSLDALAELPTRVRNVSDTGGFWMAMYFVFNLGLTLYNKGVLAPARLTTKENVTLSFFSILYTLNIAISNVSLQLVTVPFHQVVRASAPIPTILITLALLGNRGRGFLGVGKARLLTLMPVMLGVAFATYGDYYFTTWGLVLTLLGTFLAALKTVITNMLQTTTKSASVPETSFPASPKTPHPQRGTGRTSATATSPSKMKLHPLDLLLRMSPLAFLQCMLYAYVSGELHGVRNQFTGLGDINMSQRRFWALMINGCIAFGLNIINRPSANVKQVLTICLAVVIFDLNITLINGVGILFTLLGGMWYGAIEYQEKKAKTMFFASQAHPGPEKERVTSV